MMLNTLSEKCVPSPLKTRVRARFGVTSIIPGVLPAEIGATAGRTSLEASTTYTPADALPALTLLVRNARYLSPLVCVLLEGEEAPQLSHRLVGRMKSKKISTFGFHSARSEEDKS